ncbi:MAG: cell wall hydrolase [Alphaproteobacteria bacterium]|nr:cell wall hydrolase [Alphaproteobacteria bacterium]
MVTKKDIDILARTIYGEARGEYDRPNGGLASFIAVANVVMNRVTQQTWFGRSIGEVCQKPWQFSCWNLNDPNCLLIQNVTLDDGLFVACQGVAEAVADGHWPDITKGSDHYYSQSLKQPPKWSVGRTPKLSLGHHIFYTIGG